MLPSIGIIIFLLSISDVWTLDVSSIQRFDTIDLDASVDKIEAQLFDGFTYWRKSLELFFINITNATRNRTTNWSPAMIKERIRLHPNFATTVSSKLAEAFANGPRFIIPRTIVDRSPSKAVVGNRRPQRIEKPLCGAEIQQLSCKLVNYYNLRRVFFIPFDLEQLLSLMDYRTGVPYLHRNAPLSSIIRLCAGDKALTVSGSETCMSPLILQKLIEIVDQNSQQSNNYITVKAILRDSGAYSDGHTPFEHDRSRAVDFLCCNMAPGDVRPLGSNLSITGQRDCSVIAQLCRYTASNHVLYPAELYSCGTNANVSVHCTWHDKEVLNLANSTLNATLDAVHRHYHMYDDQVKDAIVTTFTTTLDQAVTKQMDPETANTAMKANLEIAVRDVMFNALEDNMILNTSQLPTIQYGVQFSGISFHISSGSSAPRNNLRRRRQSAVVLNVSCPPEIASMAKQLLQMYSDNKIGILNSFFSAYNLTSIFSTFNTTIQADASNTAPTTNQTALLETIVTNEGKSDDNNAAGGALENLIRLTYGQKAINSDGTETCLSYELLLGVQNLANQFYDNYGQPMILAALTSTPFHYADEPEAKKHTAGLAGDTLCGTVYRNSAATSQQFSYSESLYCPELTGLCYGTGMFQVAEMASDSHCLQESLLGVFGIVHCRTR